MMFRSFGFCCKNSSISWLLPDLFGAVPESCFKGSSPPGGLRGTGRQAKRSLVFQAFIRHLLCQAAFDSRPRPAVPQAPRLPDPARHPATIGLTLPSPQTPAPAPSCWEWNPRVLRGHTFQSPLISPWSCRSQFPPTPQAHSCLGAGPHRSPCILLFSSFSVLFTSSSSGYLFTGLRSLSPARWAL